VACVAPIIASLRELKALKKVVEVGVSAPTPIARFKHSLVTSLVEGALLQECYELEDPKGFFNELLGNISKSIGEAGVVHGDLSAYNIVVTPGEEPLLIDWPQWVSINHPSAKSLIKRDLSQLCAFFKKRFNLKVSLGDALREVGVE